MAGGGKLCGRPFGIERSGSLYEKKSGSGYQRGQWYAGCVVFAADAEIGAGCGDSFGAYQGGGIDHWM